MKAENPVQQKAFVFAVDIVKFCRNFSAEFNEYVLSKQLLKSGTSIGANIEEALNGQSKKVFIAKLSISLKEANESRYWIRLIEQTHDYKKDEVHTLYVRSEELIRLLTSIIKSSKNNMS